MARQQSEIQKKAFRMWCDSGRIMKPADIAKELGVKPEIIRKWKSYYKWEEKPNPKRGAPRGNKNAKNNKGGNGAPKENDYAVKHGLFRKILPDDPDTLAIFESTEDMSTLDMLWYNIRVSWTNIMRSQRIQHVTGKDEMIKELKKTKQQFEHKKVGKSEDGSIKYQSQPTYLEEEYEIQFAWDRQAASLTSQSAAMAGITRMIKQYEAMLRDLPADQILEEQRLRIEKLKSDIKLDKDDLTAEQAAELIQSYQR